MKPEGAGRHGLWGLSRNALVVAATCSISSDATQNYGIIADSASPPGGDVALRRLGGGSQHAADANTTAPQGAHSDEHHSGAFRPVSFVLVALGISAFSQWAIKLVPIQLRPPHSVLLFFIGSMLAGADYGGTSEWASILQEVETMDPHVVFWLLLPALLYEDSAGSEWHVIKRVIPSSLLLAFPAVVVNTLLTGLLVQHGLLHSFSFWDAMLLGSMLSATDPVAVVAALKELKAPAKLASLIMGESLFNDGSAFALFLIFLDQAKLRDHPDFHAGESLLRFLRLAIGGPLWGLAVGVIVVCFLRVTKSFNTQIVVVALGIYGAFFVAEHEAFQLSGVLATVTFGLFMAGVGYLSFNVETERDYHAVIKFLALLSHELIFIIAGVVSRALIYNTSCHGEELGWDDVWDLLILYVYIHATRALVIAASFPLLARMGYGLTWKEALVCAFGGLRGAVGVAMALLVTDNAVDACRIGFHMCGIVFLTLAINGNFIVDVYKALKVYKVVSEDTRNKFLFEGLENADKEVRHYMDQCKGMWQFHNCEWDIIRSLIPELVDIVRNSEGKDYFGKPKLGDRSTATAKVGDAMAQLGKLMEENLGNDRGYLTTYYMAKLERRSADIGDLRAQIAKNSASSAAEGDEAPPRKRQTFSAHHSEYLNKLWESDADMRVLSYKMVVNVVRTQYHHKLEEGELSPEPFAILKASLSYQDDAIGGELQGTHGHDFLVEFASLDKEQQATKSFDVAWRYIDSVLGVPEQVLFRRLLKKSFLIGWLVLKRDLEVLSAYEGTMRRILVDLPLLDSMSQVIAEPILGIMEASMRSAYTDKMMEPNPPEFYFADHITCALYILRHQNEMVTEAVAGGFVDEEAAHDIKNKLIKPCQRALQEYVPTTEALSYMGSQRKIHNKVNRFASNFTAIFGKRGSY